MIELVDREDDGNPYGTPEKLRRMEEDLLQRAIRRHFARRQFRIDGESVLGRDLCRRLQRLDDEVLRELSEKLIPLLEQIAQRRDEDIYTR